MSYKQNPTSKQNSINQKQFVEKRKRTQKFIFSLFRSAAVINGIALVILTGFLLFLGLPAISLEFLTEMPRDSMTSGGIFPTIIGTLILSLGSMLIAFPIGVSSAIYLSEYAVQGKFTRILRLGINNLAGVPSIVFGLFGLAFFVTYFNWGVSILSGICTLGILTLPVIIGTAEEALQGVPQTYREASLGLGATKWQTIWRVVLPSALPGMLTGFILGISRVAGETAAIMFTAAVFFKQSLPNSILDSVMALPYHIYILATAGTDIEKTRPLQYGSALVLIALVFSMNFFAIWLRNRMQK